MGSAAEQIKQHIEKALVDHPSATTIEIIHIAGEKGDDATKLNYLEPIVVNITNELRPSAEVKFRTQKVTPEQSKTDISKDLSATQVRKDAYICFLTADKDAKYTCFAEKYRDFYGIYTERIYNQIIDSAKKHTLEQLNEYIVHGKIPKTPRPSTSTQRTPESDDNPPNKKSKRSTRRTPRPVTIFQF